MATLLKQKDGTTATTAVAACDLGHNLYLRIGPGTSIDKGGDYYVKEGIAGNGDVTYRWHHYEPQAK